MRRAQSDGGPLAPLSLYAPRRNVPFAYPALAEVPYGTKSRPDHPTWQFYLAGARVHRPRFGNQETNVFKPDHPRRTTGCSDSSQQNARRARPRAKARLVETNAQSIHQYLDRCLELCAKPRLRAKSLKDYEGLLRRYVRPELGTKALASIPERSPVRIYKWRNSD